jgi:hypothetical protein
VRGLSTNWLGLNSSYLLLASIWGLITSVFVMNDTVHR